MKILIAGGLGFIGHHVTAKLQSLGHDCTIVDNYEDYGILNKKELFEILMERRLLLGNANEIYADIRTYSNYSNVDAIVHLASYPRAKAVDLNLIKASETMLAGTVKLCHAASKNNAKFVYVSSSMVYGDWQTPKANENQICKPKSLYGLMKLQGEDLTKAICPNNYIIIRPSAVYGPRDVTNRVVSLMFNAALNNNTIKVEGADNMLDFTYVDDIVDGIVNAVCSKETCHTVNMSNGNSRSLYELATLIKQITNSGSIIESVDHNIRYPKRGSQDIELARKIFNFNPQTSLEVGLAKTYDWLKKKK